MSVQLSEWIDRLREEYLETFIAAGGAAVKIVVVAPQQAPTVLETVSAVAEAQRYFVARVDAATTRVHMMHQVFCQLAAQVDWDQITERWLRGLLLNNGILVSDDQSLQNLDALAEANGRDRRALLNEINRLIESGTIKNYALNKDFRTAMAMLCWGHVNPQNVAPTDAELIKRWLRGEKYSLTALRRAQIYERINRQNARWLLGSLALWLRQVGYTGITLLLDLNAVVTNTPPALPVPNGQADVPPATQPPPLRYTRGALLDTYEVLRQFIDETDEMAYFLIVAVAGPGLLDDPKRSVDNYTALKLRIVDEVHDRHRSNPLNAMVRLEV